MFKNDNDQNNQNRKEVLDSQNKELSFSKDNHQKDQSVDDDDDDEIISENIQDIKNTSKKNKINNKMTKILTNFIYQFFVLFRDLLIQVIRGTHNQLLTICVVLPLISFFGFYHKNNDSQRSLRYVQQYDEDEESFDQTKIIIYDHSFQYFLFIMEAMLVIVIGTIFILTTRDDSLTYTQNVFKNVFTTKQLIKYRLAMLVFFLWLELVFIPFLTSFFLPKKKKWTSAWTRKFYFSGGLNTTVFGLFLVLYFLGAVYVVYYIIFFIYWLKKNLD